jgi:hypothetical protein
VVGGSFTITGSQLDAIPTTVVGDFVQYGTPTCRGTFDQTAGATTFVSDRADRGDRRPYPSGSICAGM